MIGLTVATVAQSFDNQSVNAGDTLIKTTYFGDANFDGKVDGSDYSKIDSAFRTQAPGWSNGDFNYDGVINGSDYTLIDNAFNAQATSLAAQIVRPVDHSFATAAQPIVLGTNTASDDPNEKHHRQSLAQDLEEITGL